MLLTIDIGNTNLSIGAFDGDELKFVSRLATDRSRTDDQYAIELQNIFVLYGYSFEAFDGCAISSVVPELTGTLESAAVRITGKAPLILGPGVKTGINIILACSHSIFPSGFLKRNSLRVIDSIYSLIA